jgi:hypothetical protein
MFALRLNDIVMNEYLLEYDDHGHSLLDNLLMSVFCSAYILAKLYS